MIQDSERLLEKEAQDGRRARQLLDDPMVAAFFREAKEITIAKMLAASDDKQKLRQVDYLQAINLLEANFQTYIDTGKMAQTQLSFMERAKDFLKRA